jgi:hypothetical protein
MPAHRIHNFNPGPAALPLPVLEEIQASLLNFKSSGMSIMEVSHRFQMVRRRHQRRGCPDQAAAELRRPVSRALSPGRREHAVCHDPHEFSG